MADEIMMAKAKSVLDGVCKMLDAQELKYDRDDEKMFVFLQATGEDLPMKFFFIVKPDVQELTLYSPMGFKIPEDKRIDTAVAVCVANYGFRIGSFDYDITDGEIRFRIAQSFMDGSLSENLLETIFLITANTVDRYNDRFMSLGKGLIDLQKFIELDKNN